MQRYSIEPREWIFVKDYRFFYLTKNISKKNLISKNLVDKYILIKHLDSTNKSAADLL